MIRKAAGLATLIVAAPAIALLPAGTAMAQDGAVLTIAPGSHDDSMLSIAPVTTGDVLSPSTRSADPSAWSFDEAPVSQDDVHALVNIAGPVVDARCLAAWTDGPAAGAVGSDYNACDTASMDNQRTEAPNSGPLVLS